MELGGRIGPAGGSEATSTTESSTPALGWMAQHGAARISAGKIASGDLRSPTVGPSVFLRRRNSPMSPSPRRL